MGDFEKLIDAAQRGNLTEVKAILLRGAQLINQRDDRGATALHYAALGGHREAAQALVEQGADINCRDGEYSATPAGWAIEYLREMGGVLGIELDDFAYAIQRGDVEWVARFLKRFPALRGANDIHGVSFQQLAQELGNPEIAKLFGTEAAL